MAKLRSYFVRDLDGLKSSISDLLAFNSESNVDEIIFQKFLNRFEDVSILLRNRDFIDLIRKN